MIIKCINCGKKFHVNSELIPTEGRTIQCGSCNHIWFFKKNDPVSTDFSRLKIDEKPVETNKIIQPKKENIKKEKNEATIDNNIQKSSKVKGSEIVKYKSKSNFTFSSFLSYIIVIIISFIALVILIDTFKFQLYDIYPELEILLYSFYETLKDIQLFIKDLT